MEKYVENYFEKLKDFEENSSKFVALRKKEANFVSLLSESLNDVLKGTEPYLGFNGRNREETFGSVHKEALQIHKKNRKQILELYSKDSNTADKLYIYLKKQYDELWLEATDLYKYGSFDKGNQFAQYLAMIVSAIEGKMYNSTLALYEGKTAIYGAQIIVAEDVNIDEQFSSVEEFRSFCNENSVIVVRESGHYVGDNYPVFCYDEKGYFLHWNLSIPEKLSYMRDAISCLINIKMERKDENTSEETIRIFENTFFGSMIEKVEENYALRKVELDTQVSVYGLTDGIKRKIKITDEQYTGFMTKYKKCK